MGNGQAASDIITDAIHSDPATLEAQAGWMGKSFITAVDTAVRLQSSSIKAYVHWLRRQNPEATPAQVQEKMDRHFRTTVSGTGAGAGLASAVPGIGLVTGAAAIASESVVFLDLAAFYTVASAYLRGVDIDDPQRRRAVVLVALTGAQGLAIVDTILGAQGGVSNLRTLSRFSGPTLVEANNILTRAALRSVTKRLRRAWLGKFLPLGVGAVAGTMANRKLARVVRDNIASSLGPLPQRFAEALPATESEEEKDVKRASSPREFIGFVVSAITPGKSDGSDGSGDSDDSAATVKEQGNESDTSAGRRFFRRRRS
ncbi:hypothetical protein C3E79_04315 [Corynebacterium liangguodongii]|uniref:Uncharacterized protein n=1 Tax=Corynebacterium liangguodongii TaxID=2079535 RepID=A0A2S0WGZ7_9CORY|nr:hypothetical protein C3E79_04315 [Corynebacterium liangguodongii]PWB98988.1 hypothetical protein DF219_09005 [Corynebacterium liangguodongii]